MFCFWIKPMPQTGHVKGRSLLWVNLWFLKFVLMFVVYGQWGQWNRFSFLFFMPVHFPCLINAWNEINNIVQFPHWYWVFFISKTKITFLEHNFGNITHWILIIYYTQAYEHNNTPIKNKYGQITTGLKPVHNF